MADLERLLISIGKACFVQNYFDFKNCQNKQEFAKRLLDQNPKAYSLQAQNTRISKAKKIFSEQLERQALINIIHSKDVDAAAKNLAQQILSATQS